VTHHLRKGNNIFVLLRMYVFSLIAQIRMFQYVSNINSYCEDGSREYDGFCQLFLLAIQTPDRTATKFFFSVGARTIFTSSQSV
jgi:hypothetical protein